MTQINQQHEGRQQYVEAVTSSAQTNQEELTKHLLARFAGREGAAAAVEAAVTLLAFEAQLAQERLGDLGGAELKLAQELGEDQAARTDRDAPLSDLVGYLERLRARIVSDAGDAVARRLGLSKPPAERLAAVKPYAEAVIQLCREANLTLSDLVMGTDYTSAALADGVEQRLSAFTAATDAVTREERETQAARAVRDGAADDFSQDVYAGAQLLEALYRQAGMTAHAERIRPSVRRVSGRLQDDPILSADPTAAATGVTG
jgi:hypothetical protein